MDFFCILCGQQTPHFPLYGLLKQCEKCSLVSAREELFPEYYAGLYGENYFFDGEYRNYLEEKTPLQKNFRKWIETIKRFEPTGRLLEIGSAYGFFLELAQKKWKSEGIDISGPGCEHARSQGLDVKCGDFLQIPVEKESFQIVCLWDTIEHLKSPHRYIQKISEVLTPGGHICLTTGDIDGLIPRVQKERWRMIHPPTHLYYFSQKTLSELLKVYHLRVVHTSYVGFNRSVKRVLFNLAAQRKAAFWQNLYSYYEHLKLKDFSFYVNLFDIIFLIAEKEK